MASRGDLPPYDLVVPLGLKSRIKTLAYHHAVFPCSPCLGSKPQYNNRENAQFEASQHFFTNQWVLSRWLCPPFTYSLWFAFKFLHTALGNVKACVMFYKEKRVSVVPSYQLELPGYNIWPGSSITAIMLVNPLSSLSQIFAFVVTLCYGCSMVMGFKRWRK